MYSIRYSLHIIPSSLCPMRHRWVIHIIVGSYALSYTSSLGRMHCRWVLRFIVGPYVSLLGLTLCHWTLCGPYASLLGHTHHRRVLCFVVGPYALLLGLTLHRWTLCRPYTSLLGHMLHCWALRFIVGLVPVMLGWAAHPVPLLVVMLGWAALLLQPPHCVWLGPTPPPPPLHAVFGLYPSSNSSSCCYHISVGEHAVRGKKMKRTTKWWFTLLHTGFLPSSLSSPPPFSLLCHPPDLPVITSAFIIAIVFPFSSPLWMGHENELL